LAYKTMAIEGIAALPVGEMAEKDAHLYIWIPDCHLLEGHGATVARAWGFEPGRLVVWKKTGYGLGTFPRPQHESLIVCRRGKLPFQVRDQGSVQTFRNPYENGARVHSAKPDGMLDLIERNSPGPYLELFARRARFGWDYWGDQSLGTAEMPEPKPVPDLVATEISGGGGTTQMTVDDVLVDIEGERVVKWPAEAIELVAERIYRSGCDVQGVSPAHWTRVLDSIRELYRQDARALLLALNSFLPATQQSGDGLEQALADAIELAQEGWAYASPYFNEKWESQERIGRLQAALDTSQASGGGGE
jgi:N6-adenosine-specific RNA methylase IME4